MKFWRSDISVEMLSGGLTNQNFRVNDKGKEYFVRYGVDIPEHGVMRFNELAASRAAFLAGISPEVIHAEPGIIVLDYIEGQPLTDKEVKDPVVLRKIIQLMLRCHYQLPKYYRGPALAFWVFQVVRDYIQTVQESNSHWKSELGKLSELSNQLEQQVGEVEMVFGHNDLLAANFMQDKNKIWLIDWEYAGFNSPLFDLAGLASNNQLSAEQEMHMLQLYYGKEVDSTLRRKYSAMKCASLLRETLWSMVSEIHSVIDFDYAQYTQKNLDSFELAWAHHSKF